MRIIRYESVDKIFVSKFARVSRARVQRGRGIISGGRWGEVGNLVVVTHSETAERDAGRARSQ